MLREVKSAAVCVCGTCFPTSKCLLISVFHLSFPFFLSIPSSLPPTSFSEVLLTAFICPASFSHVCELLYQQLIRGHVFLCTEGQAGPFPSLSGAVAVSSVLDTGTKNRRNR